MSTVRIACQQQRPPAWAVGVRLFPDAHCCHTKSQRRGLGTQAEGLGFCYETQERAVHMAPLFGFAFLRSFGLEKMQGCESGRLCIILVFPGRKGLPLREQSGGLRLQPLSWTLAHNC